MASSIWPGEVCILSTLLAVRDYCGNQEKVELLLINKTGRIVVDGWHKKRWNRVTVRCATNQERSLGCTSRNWTLPFWSGGWLLAEIVGSRLPRRDLARQSIHQLGDGVSTRHASRYFALSTQCPEQIDRRDRSKGRGWVSLVHTRHCSFSRQKKTTHKPSTPWIIYHWG